MLRRSRPSSRIVLTVLIVLLLGRHHALAFETDQFALPPMPLADIGDEVSEHVEKRLLRAVGDINAEIARLELCLAGGASKSVQKKCLSPAKNQARIEYLRSEEAVVRKVYRLLGTGVPPFTRIDWWIETNKFSARPARYRPPPWKSIFSFWPTSGLALSSTVNMYGSQFGTDKIAHLFQQGYDYYKIVEREVAEGKTAGDAERAALAWGQKTERTFFGTRVSGVYSNADLCANFVGLRFYQALTREVSLGGLTRAPLFSLEGGVWVMNESPEMRRSLLRPFVSDHFNEALNPSVYTPLLGLRSLVRRTVKKRDCALWLKLDPPIGRAVLEQITKSLELWRGEDYGFTTSDYFVTITNTCFDDDELKLSSPKTAGR